MTQEFRLPDVGEGLHDAEIVQWKVAVGDEVDVNDVIVEIETAKSLVELPSPFSGRVSGLHAQEGDTVEVGSLLISVDARASAGEAADDVTEGDGEAEKPLVLVGTGPSASAPRRRRLSAPDDRPGAAVVSAAPDTAPAAVAAPSAPRATPPVRLLAKTLGVPLESIAPDDGSPIRREAVERAAARRDAPAPTPTTETRIPIRGVRKATAAAMVASAFTAPHVTEWLTVDVTETMDLLAELRADKAWSGIRLTPLVFVAKALLLAIRRYPEINATWREAEQEIVVKPSVHLGIAAATPRGLLVPNIKDAHTLDLAALAGAMTELVAEAREGRVSPERMSGGTITITNIGAFGVDAGTPILNPGEAAILAFGAVRPTPWVVSDAVVPRQVTQLALSFDHRLVDGELGSRVLAEVGTLLRDPRRAFAHV
jgi:2-oxoisovalerate dehydrogenase E2 component (dihydrolipoyl transacylase)